MQIESFQCNFQRHKSIRDSKDFLLSVSKFMLKKEPAPQVDDLILEIFGIDPGEVRK